MARKRYSGEDVLKLPLKIGLKLTGGDDVWSVSAKRLATMSHTRSTGPSELPMVCATGSNSNWRQRMYQRFCWMGNSQLPELRNLENEDARLAKIVTK
ncbi:hypothetical protein CLV78_10771 [Aliiruegeria haliotis]|uniref:Uncharacterized protein n=1 Tax=Aliiruegeria haliotis TaxID=1280846 RepID=A0A2T0RLY6_9RHOB|nr:hypothetical protein CLV78_10771 [Aliiruegeria haliotis]